MTSFTDEMRVALDSPDEKQRVLAAALFKNHPDPSTRLRIEELAADDSAVDVRKMALAALGKLGDPASLTVVERAAGEDPEEWVRWAAVWALPPLSEGIATEALISALRDPAARVRRAAAHAVGDIGDRAGGVHLIPLLADPTRGIRVSAAQALVKIPTLAAKDALLERVGNDKSAWVRIASASALAEIPDPSVVAALRRARRRELNPIARPLLRLYEAGARRAARDSDDRAR